MKYIIHRGLTSNKNKENSYLAIRNAILDKNSSGVEFDIRLTKDNKIVLSHDSIIGINYIENMNDIDMTNCLIRIVGKGNKEREIPIGEYSIYYLMEYLKVRE